ncbi:MAG TPA: M13 family metallopeptidase [Vicinamibacterales bacterium]|nr:M13 family metallopeptidase [Vicinamibacterales bacterium]
MRTLARYISICIIAGVVALSPAVVAQQAQQPAAAKPPKPLHFGTWGVDLSGMDRSVNPADDFDKYVNGAWFAKTEIPADQGSAGVGYDVFNLSQDQIRAVIENAPPTTQLGAMYRSFMNEAAVESVDDKPLQEDLKRVAAIPDKAAFTKFMGETSGRFGFSLFGPGVAPDPAKPEINTLFLGQAGLGLPDRDYYLTDSFKPQRDAYRAYLERVLTMTHDPAPAKSADAVMAFETTVAKASWPAADRRDIDKVNNPMSVADLQTYAPGLDWSAFLTASSIAKRDHMIVLEKTAIRDIAKIYADTPLETLKAWQVFHVTDQGAPYLSKRFVDSRFAFTKTLSGVSELRPRWKRGAALIDSTLGELLGRTYVETYFPASSKAKMNELVANLKTAMGARIQKSDWMAPETKKAAIEKLGKMDVMVGYPDKWRDYAPLKVDVNDLYGNAERSSKFEWDYQLSDLGKPVDHKKWAMTPQTVNAYNGGLENKIVFPAGILQAPFFDPTADAAVNYGAIGAIIGHEISHGFDDQGRKIDGTGAVRDWWTKADADRFDTQAKGFGAQYDTYEPVPGVHVNGQLTMGENIADLAGVLIALDAYHASLGGRKAPVVDGLTGDQRFFLGFAQAWRSKERDDAMKAQMASDPHTPDKYRIIGPLRNVDAWYDAFDVTAGKYFLKPGERTRIW